MHIKRLEAILNNSVFNLNSSVLAKHFHVTGNIFTSKYNGTDAIGFWDVRRKKTFKSY